MHSGRNTVLFIVNEVLAKKGGYDVPRLVGDFLDADRFLPEVVFSEYPGHAEEIARRRGEEFDMLVAGGGDGTVNQVACSLVNTDTVLGILPLGSGKGLARSLRIPLNLRKAIDVLSGSNLALLDTGKAGPYRFVNIAGVGFAAEVAHAYSGSARRGFIPYARNTLGKLPGASPVSVNLRIGDRHVEGKYFDISMANSKQWGYGARISPLSRPGDGIFELCLFRPFPLLRSPELLARLFTGSIHRSRYMEVIPTGSVWITGDGPFKGHVDGEPVEFPASFGISIEPGSLKVVHPLKG